MFGSEREWDVFKTHPVESEPMVQFKKLFAQVERSSDNGWAHNFAFCTVDPSGQPTSRVVSMHSFDERGFYFCTNTCGPKAVSLEANPKSAMVFQWEPIRVQVRITGTAEQLDEEATLALFNRCSKAEKLYYISCSQGPDHPWSQSKEISPEADWDAWRSELFLKYAHIDETELPLPYYWRAYIFIPKSLEILNLMMFTGARTLWTRNSDGNWTKELLAL